MGLVLTMQLRPAMIEYGAEAQIPTIVGIAIIREIGPVVTALIFAGKIASSIGAELASMKVTEQIDALDVMGINAASYLIMPKIFGAIIAFPMLVAISAFLGTSGGMFAGTFTGEVTYTEFTEGARAFFEPFQVTFMIIKSITFGFIISSVSAYQGFYVRGGAKEVGEASTRAVVYSCILVLFSDYVLAQLLL
jgi:phospholipid/cholesterol/gamma-HCH transport system permease protein